jgi:hypothetical protein
LLIHLSVVYAEYLQYEFTVTVNGGQLECFHQHVKSKHELEVGYNVIESSTKYGWLFPPSGSADFKIGFEMRTEKSEIVYQDEPTTENQHVHSVEQEGDFAICLDNRHNSYGLMLVNLEVYVYSEDDIEEKWGFVNSENDLSLDEKYEEKVEDLKVSVLTITL